MTAIYPTTEARENLAEIINRSAVEAVFIERYGKAVAVVISPEMWEKAQEALEDISDIQAIEESIASNRPLKQVDDIRKELGL